MNLEKIILGHNPFFGVDHLSQDKGNQKELKFEDETLLADTLLYARELGVQAIMISTHPRAEVMVDIIEKNNLLADMKVYPLLPYIAKYVRQANEKGLTNLLYDVLSKAKFSQKVSLMLTGASSIFMKDIDKVVRLLVDVEFLPFRKRNIGAIFIHDSLTDLALGLGAEYVLEIYKDHVEKKYKVPAGFITKNLDNFRNKVEKRGWKDYLVMASINKTGFYVNPSIDVTVSAIERPGINFIGMNTLAGGALKPEDAYEFLGNINNLNSVVVGMSQKAHIKETVNTINAFIN